jgi:hypothetical protein
MRENEMGETQIRVMRNAQHIIIGQLEGKRRLRKPRHRWKVCVRMDLREIVWEYVDWIHLAGSCEHCNELFGSIKGRKFLD